MSTATNTLARACPVCGGERPHEPLYEKWGHAIVRCTVCGVGATVVPPDFDPGAIYGEGYYTGEAADGYADYAGSEAVLRTEFRGAVERLRAVGPRTGRLLELGAAYGFLQAEAQPFFEPVGVEVCAEAAGFARARGLDVRQGLADRAFFESVGRFDAVVLMDVIEHLPDPAETLTLARDALEPGGCVMISTGDWESLLARLTGRRWRLMTPPQHLWFFSPRTLRLMLERLGFEVLTTEKPWKRVPLGLAAYQVLSRLGLKARPPAALARVGVPVNLFDAFRLIARKRNTEPGTSSREAAIPPPSA